MGVSSSLKLFLLLVFVVVGGCLKLPSINITNIADSATGIVKGTVGASKDVVGSVAGAAKDGVKGAVNTTKGAAGIAANTTKDVAGAAVNTTKGAVGVAANTTKEGVKEVVNITKEAVDTVKDTVKDIVNPDDVCYDGLGCFSMSSPWYTILRPLPKPQSPVDIDTQFYLYTRRYPGRYTVTWRHSNESDADADAGTDGGMTLKGSDFDGRRKTFFITHGFASNGNSSWLDEMKDALLKKFDCNVFLVDWGKGASLLNYFQVASNTRVVAAVLAKLGRFLVDEHNADPARMHAIGHSLGAQISAYFAKNITTLGRLTALDPAQPAFEHYDRRVRLDRDDAVFVDVVHTSARPFLPFAGLGMVGAHGHIDFYMNGGWKQPGCYWPEKVNITSFLDLATLPVEALANLISCPHGRSYEFFTASLDTNSTFWGHRIGSFAKFFSTLTGGYGGELVIPDDDDCGADKCSPFGYEAIDYPARGKFGVGTTNGFPFVVPEPKVDAGMRQYRGLRPFEDPEPNDKSDDLEESSTIPYEYDIVEE